MLKKVFTTYFDNVLYIQLSSEKLKIIAVGSGLEFDQPPLIAIERINGKSVVKAIGHDAKMLTNSAGIEVTNPFQHPRQLIAHFQNAERILQRAIRSVCPKQLFAPTPKVVFQPLEKLEGGLTEVELRVFRELCLGAGAREVVIYFGPVIAIQHFNYEEIKRSVG